MCILSLGLFAQKAPKGKLVSYSHTLEDPEMRTPAERTFELTWKDGKGTLQKHEVFIHSVSGSTDEISEDVFLQVEKIIKEKKLYAIGRKKIKTDPELLAIRFPGQEEYTITFEDMTVKCNVKKLTDEEREALEELETFITQNVNVAPPPTGNLVQASWSFEPLMPGASGQYKSLSVKDGKAPVLVIGESTSTPLGNKEAKYIATPEDMKRLQELIIQEKAYLFDGYAGKDATGRNPETRLLLEYDNGVTFSARWTHGFPPDKVRKAEGTIMGFLNSLAKTATPATFFPTGWLAYCGVEFTNHGQPVGEIQYSYFDFICPNVLTEPKEIYFENRGGNRTRTTEYPATKKDWYALTAMLEDMEIFKLDGYNVDEEMEGGSTSCIKLKFSTGEELKASWHAENPDPQAEAAFKKIWMFLYNIAERNKDKK